MEENFKFIEDTLEELKNKSNFRKLPEIKHEGKFISTMLNLSSNDYLGLSTDEELKKEFLKDLDYTNFIPSSTSARLLTGNYSEYTELEDLLKELFASEAALVFNSGYHANTGILPSICDKETLIIADKLVHASIIDGIKLSNSTFLRYKHNDLKHLETLINKHLNEYKRIIVVTESVFSMDGDIADLPKLVELKQKYLGLMLYVDEAHAIGVYGEKGLGLAEKYNCINAIDFLVGTFGKAICSVGAYVICKQSIRDFLINKMRTFIFTTALPPINIRWTIFVLRKLASMNERREHLHKISQKLINALNKKAFCPSQSHIVPYLVGDSKAAVEFAQALQDQGFYLLAVRPPTVPEGTSRIRISLTAAITEKEVDSLIKAL